jgi:hypothetical protein
MAVAALPLYWQTSRHRRDRVETAPARYTPVGVVHAASMRRSKKLRTGISCWYSPLLRTCSIGETKALVTSKPPFLAKLRCWRRPKS